MKLNYSTNEIKLSSPLSTSYGIVTGSQNAFLTIEHDNLCGYGEAVPISRYVENIENVLLCLEIFSKHLGNEPWDIEKTNEIFNTLEIKSPAAKSAINMALYDIIGKLLCLPLYKLLGLNNLDTPYTSYTIGIDNTENVIKKILEAKNYPIIKLKIRNADDVNIIRSIREVSNVTIRIDANGNWAPEQAIKIINLLAEYNIQFVEQPVAANNIEGLKFVHKYSPIPIIADESCLSLKDIPRLSECVDGVNIKLSKCGGISEALRMIFIAKAYGLKVMIGCILESSLAITAAAHLTPLADYADLDSILFIKHDPFNGVKIDNGKIILPNAPGLGVTCNTN